ncbi:MAG: F0F1 ATP synthase subunit A [Ectothiorhodospiraceae bacterium]|nr:F0F1 ATP synthase subunit A [Ectothiorhodospiraceae bacterium]
MDVALHAPVVARIGPLALTTPVVTTWAVMGALGLGAWLARRRQNDTVGRWASAVEIVLTAIEDHLSQTMHCDARPYVPLLATLFLFLLTANLSGVVPGVVPPTAYIETAAALALVVLGSTHWYGMRRRGLRGHLATYLEPRWWMLPLNVLGEITRTFSLMVRLFGNVMSGHLVIAIVLTLAGLLVPVPLMLLEVLTGAVQAYIFTVLSAVFIGAAIGSVESG